MKLTKYEMEYHTNMLFWCLLFLAISILAISQEKSKGMAVLIISVIFVMIAFCKNTTANSDYINYLYQYERFKLGYADYEPLYNIVMQTATKIFPQYDIFKVFLSAIQIVLLYIAVRKLTPNVAMVFALYLIFPAILEGELTRYTMASFIVIFSFLLFFRKNVEEKVKTKDVLFFVILVLIAALIHNSMLVFASFCLFPIFCKKSSLSNRNQRWKEMLLIILIVSCILFGITYFGKIIVNVLSFSSKSAYNFSDFKFTQHSLNILVYYLCIHMIRIGFSYYLFSICNKEINKKKVDDMKYTRDSYCFKYVNHLLSLNIFSIVLVVPYVMSVNFNRLITIIDLLNYIGAAIAIDFFPRYSKKRWSIKFLVFAYALFFLLSFLLREQYYIELYKQFFVYNDILKAISS